MIIEDITDFLPKYPNINNYKEEFLKANGFELLEYAIINEPSNPNNIKEWVKKMIQKFIESKDVKAKGLSYGIVARKL